MRALAYPVKSLNQAENWWLFHFIPQQLAERTTLKEGIVRLQTKMHFASQIGVRWMLESYPFPSWKLDPSRFSETPLSFLYFCN
jgi:hypothetical protein